MSLPSASAATASEGIDISMRHAAALLTLSRPDKLNSITEPMRRAIEAALPKIARDPQIYGLVIRSVPAKAFSAGGDLLELYTQLAADPALARRNVAQEYGLVWQLDCFPKPTVSLIDGPVMGSGVGLTLFGTHRAAGEHYRFRMPETGIGFIPDVGAAYAFARMPHQIGIYLGLTGRAIGRADALALGLATHCIPASQFAEIEDGVANADPVDPLLADRHVDPGSAPVMEHAETIERCFSAETVEEILARLVSGREQQAWCAEVAAELERRSPLALKVTLRQIRDARHLDLRQVLATDYRIACRMMAAPDFNAAVDALLISKTKVPRWRPAAIEDVSPGMVERVVAPMPGDELVLPPLNEMVMGRA